MEKILFISSSTLDKKSLIMTLIVCVFPPLGLGWLFYHYTVPAIITGGTVALFLSIFILGLISTPYKYILTNSHLLIKRHIKDIVIPLQNIKLIRLMTPDDKKGMLRTFGADGAFGSWGYFQTEAHGKLMVFVRRRNNWTLIVTDRKKYVIAPDDLQLIDATANQIGQAETDVPTMKTHGKQWYKWIPVALIAVTAAFFYAGYREPGIELDSNSFKMKGLYGVNIPFAEITTVDTLAWHEMPAISIRTNGISFFKVNRGYFRTVDGDNIRMSVYCGESPVIRIVDRNGGVYYINRKDADETRLIFKQLSK